MMKILQFRLLNKPWLVLHFSKSKSFITEDVFFNNSGFSLHLRASFYLRLKLFLKFHDILTLLFKQLIFYRPLLLGLITVLCYGLFILLFEIKNLWFLRLEFDSILCLMHIVLILIGTNLVLIVHATILVQSFDLSTQTWIQKAISHINYVGC